MAAGDDFGVTIEAFPHDDGRGAGALVFAREFLPGDGAGVLARAALEVGHVLGELQLGEGELDGLNRRRVKRGGGRRFGLGRERVLPLTAVVLAHAGAGGGVAAGGVERAELDWLNY